MRSQDSRPGHTIACSSSPYPLMAVHIALGSLFYDSSRLLCCVGTRSPSPCLVVGGAGVPRRGAVAQVLKFVNRPTFAVQWITRTETSVGWSRMLGIAGRSSGSASSLCTSMARGRGYVHLQSCLCTVYYSTIRQLCSLIMRNPRG